MVPHQLARRHLAIAGDKRDQLRGGAAVDERPYLRLQDRGGAIEGACVAPAFEHVQGRQVKSHALGGLVDICRELDRQRDARHCRGEPEIARRVVDRIGVENYQGIHLAAVHVAGKLANPRAVAGIDRNRFDIAQGGARSAERRVDRVRERVNSRRLLAAGMDEGDTAMCGEVAGNRFDPERVLPVTPCRRAGADGSGDRPQRDLDLLRLQHKAVVGNSAHKGRRRLDCVDPAHPTRSRLGGAAALSESAGKGEVSRRPGDRIAFDCQNDIGILEQGQRVDAPVKSEECAGIDCIARNRPPLMPARGRILPQ